MISKSLYTNILLYVLLIVISCIGIAYFLIEKNNIQLTLLSIFAALIEVMLLIRYLNKTNRRLAFFIDSVKNEDTAIKFPKDIKNKPVLDLYQSLNVLNDIIRKSKIEIGYNEQLLKTLIENSSTGFVTIEEHGNFEVLNHQARKYLAVTHTSNMERLKQEDPQLHSIFSTLQPGKTKTYQIHRENDIYHLSISVAQIKYYEKNFKVVSMQDISSEMDEQELASWHKLFRVITHEIMNSIAPITSLSQTLTQFYTNNAKPKKPQEISEKNITDTLSGLHVINEMCIGLTNFVGNYRQLNKIPKPILKTIPIQSWLTNLKTIVQEMIQNQSINLNISLSNNCASIYSDEKLLNLVIINIIKNAIDAMEKTPEGKLNIHVSRAEDTRTHIIVSDNGKGISEEDLDKIFVPFFTTKEQGNGIGLSLSKQIMKALGGNISIRSTVNEGTQATLTL